MGCVNAIDLDGGGSATHASVHQGASGQTLRVRNSPSDGSERAISDALLLVSTAGQCQHDYSKNYVINSDGTHSVSCKKCNNQIVSGHYYADGVCACGDREEVADYLHFGFSNNASAQERYNNAAYGYCNFDNPKGDPWVNSYWSTGTNGTTNYPFQINNKQGILIADVGNDGSPLIAPSYYYNGFPWFGEGSRSRYPLGYIPKDAEYFQIYFKTENCIAKSGTSAQIKLHYHYKINGEYTRSVDKPVNFTVTNGKYQNITLAIPEAVRSGEVMGTFLIEYINLISEDGGSISIDFMYIGPKQKLPIALHTVTFVDGDGKVLQTQSVLNGGSVTYSGQTPTKTSDADYHYSFDAWDLPLNNIKADTTIRATFTPIEHSFTYSQINQTSHKATCDCGYNAELLHNYSCEVSIYPTKTQVGRIAAVCTLCLQQMEIILPALNNTDYIVTVKEDATCTEGGSEIYLWNVTDYGVYSFSAEIEATGHTEVIDQAVAPTCTTTGLTEGKHCSVCNKVLVAQNVVSALGHSYNAVVSAPTCENDGFSTYTCTVCNDSYIADNIAALGHNYTATVTKPNCTDAGYTTYLCSVCGDNYIGDEVNAYGHSYNDGIVTLEPNCTTEGVKTFTCASCGDSYTEVIPANGHDLVFRAEKEATCTEDGYKYHYYCTSCEGTFFDEAGSYHAPWNYLYLKAIGHNYEAVVTAPTCTEAGYTTYTCTCGDKYTANEVAALGHSYEAVVAAPTCTEAGYTTYTCACGDKYTADETAALGHSYTYTNNGENHTIGCANCDLTEIADHEFVDGNCFCGAVEVTEPEIEVLESLNVTPNISIGAEIQVMYTIMARSLTAYESFYLEVSKTVAGGEPIVTTYGLSDDMIKFEEVKSGSNVVAYRAIYTGIGAKNMGDEFTTTLYAITADGAIKCGYANTTSIKSYLLSKIEDAGSLPVLKNLAVDMLNYGAAAQVNFDYDAENLVNADLTDAQKALGTQVKAEATDMQAISGTGAAIAASVSVQNKVFMYLTVRYAATDASKVKFIIKDSEGKIIAELIPTALAGGKVFQASYDGVGAKQMREPITIEMQEDGVTVSQSLTWSVESYVAQTRASSATGENLMNMVNALLIYGDSAANYLKST